MVCSQHEGGIFFDAEVFRKKTVFIFNFEMFLFDIRSYMQNEILLKTFEIIQPVQFYKGQEVFNICLED